MNTDKTKNVIPNSASQKQQLINEYIASLSPLAKKGLAIAQDHLQSSFSIEKSIGFIEFLKHKGI